MFLPLQHALCHLKGLLLTRFNFYLLGLCLPDLFQNQFQNALFVGCIDIFPQNGLRFSEHITEPTGHLDICPGMVQLGHLWEKDVDTERIDRFQSIRVYG